MKKKLVVALLSVTLTAGAAVGCNSAWWQNFKNNPVAQVQTFEQSVQVVLSIAETTWGTLSVLLPANVLAQAQPLYTKAVLAANAALTALNDAVQVAVNAQSPSPDFSALMQAVSDAIAQVVAVINQFKTAVPVTPTPAAVAAVGALPGFAELEASVATMHRVGGVK